MTARVNEVLLVDKLIVLGLCSPLSGREPFVFTSN